MGKTYRENTAPSLRNRIRTLRLISKYLDTGFKAIYCNSVFRSKLMFGLETWGGAQKTQINMVQKLQDQASKLALDKTHHKLNPRQRQQLLGWLNIKNEIIRATHTQTYKILHTGKPEEISTQMPENKKTLRIKDHKKLDTRPRWLGANKTTQSSYRCRAYQYNTLPARLTTLKDLKKFKKEIKEYLKYRCHKLKSSSIENLKKLSSLKTENH